MRYERPAVVLLLMFTVAALAASDELGAAEPAQAFELWLAAEQGDAAAQVFLGEAYLLGEGVPQDHAEAVHWFRLAAEQGQTDAQVSLAQVSLGFAYLLGRGVPQDYISAHMWLNLASASGGEIARETRDSVAEVMTRAQIAEAQRLAREWSRSR